MKSKRKTTRKKTKRMEEQRGGWPVADNHFLDTYILLPYYF